MAQVATAERIFSSLTRPIPHAYEIINLLLIAKDEDSSDKFIQPFKAVCDLFDDDENLGKDIYIEAASILGPYVSKRQRSTCILWKSWPSAYRTCLQHTDLNNFVYPMDIDYHIAGYCIYMQRLFNAGLHEDLYYAARQMVGVLINDTANERNALMVKIFGTYSDRKLTEL